MPTPVEAEAVLTRNQEKAKVPPTKNVQMNIATTFAKHNAEASPSEKVPPSQSQPPQSDRHIGSVVYGEEYLLGEEEL